VSRDFRVRRSYGACSNTGHLRQSVSDRENRIAAFDLEEQLDLQRDREWTTHGQALEAGIIAAARQIPGLTVPLEITIDINSLPAEEIARPLDPDIDNLDANLINTAATDGVVAAQGPLVIDLLAPNPQQSRDLDGVLT
jgi:hypothetical protein